MPEQSCGDGADNDCDGLTDCVDSDCDARSCGPNGERCTGGACVCPGGEATEQTCGDGADNDCDGLTDCGDPDCATAPACCVAAGPTENQCTDGVDNDCDGSVDHLDSDCWWDPAWGYRIKITFDNSAQNEDLVDFPVLVVLDDATVDRQRFALGGADIRFVDADGQTVLPYEFERFNRLTSSPDYAYLWVKVPKIDAASTTDHIWLYYGNGNAPAGENPAAVWDANYRGVYHLADLVVDGWEIGTHRDSTANGAYGQQHRNGAATASGCIHRCADFDGSEDYIVLPQSAFAGMGAITLSALARVTGEPNDYPHVVSGGDQVWELVWRANPDTWAARARVAGAIYRVASASDSLNTTRHLAMTYDGTTFRLFVDGVLAQSMPLTGPLNGLSTEVRIGDDPVDSPREFEGYIDEVRISDVARSPAWIAAQYRVQTRQFVSYGPEEPF
ncbi:MAG: DUF2341 domain-containing protein [Deltaproteobacteria bacterium]|nr:MAG: DUF2341 domain-containing protein [Deltaproteobacteria bacterium]